MKEDNVMKTVDLPVIEFSAAYSHFQNMNLTYPTEIATDDNCKWQQ